MSFQDQVILVTGGSSGIGAALARRFAAEGAHIIICGRDESQLRTVAKGHDTMLAIPCDIRSPNEVDALLQKIRDRFGRLDVLINNAGRLVERNFGQTPFEPESLANEIALNLTAHIQATNAALPLLLASKRPTIVMMGSGYSLVPVSRAPLYSAAKAGLHAFSVALRLQFGKDGPKIIEVFPPAVDTPATAHRQVRKVSADRVADETLQGIRTGREQIMVGAVRLLPMLLRLAPEWTKRRVGAT